MSKSPYGYPWADWLAREDPQYAAARQPVSELSVGEGKELSIKHREMVIIGILAFRGREDGVGADILTTLRVIEEVARADGSTGWCLAMGINSFRQSAQFAPEVRRTLFHSDPIGVSAGSANPRGRAVAVPGGYRVTGHWFFASGCMHPFLLHRAFKVFHGDVARRQPHGGQAVP